MNVLSVLGKMRKVLGWLTDKLNEGRKAGLWSAKSTPKKS